MRLILRSLIAVLILTFDTYAAKDKTELYPQVVDAICHNDTAAQHRLGDILFPTDGSPQGSNNDDMWGHIALGYLETLYQNKEYGISHLEQARYMADQALNHEAHAISLAGIAINHYVALHDAESAKRDLYNALFFVNKTGNDVLRAYILRNLAQMELKSGDLDNAYSNATEANAISADNNDIYNNLTSMLTLAEIHAVRKEFEKALKTIQTIENNSYSSKLDLAQLWTVHGDILHAIGKNDESIAYYNKSLNALPASDPRRVEIKGKYALARFDSGHATEAIGTIDNLMADSEMTKRFPYETISLLLPLSEMYSAMGRHDKAYRLSRQYIASRDSLDTSLRIKTLASLKAQYDVTRAELTVEHQREDLHRKRIMINLLIGFSILAIAAIIVIWRLYRRKSQLMEVIVSQTAQFKDKFPTPIPLVAKKENSTDSSAKPELIEKIERLFDEEKAHRDPLVTKERLAKKLATNRTYLSQAVNDYYKMSFTQLINSRRIQEAVKLLSDINSKMSVREIGEELGFSSFTTFNTNFKNAMGMTPGAYRKKCIEISHQGNDIISAESEDQSDSES